MPFEDDKWVAWHMDGPPRTDRYDIFGRVRQDYWADHMERIQERDRARAISVKAKRPEQTMDTHSWTARLPQYPHRSVTGSFTVSSDTPHDALMLKAWNALAPDLSVAPFSDNNLAHVFHKGCLMGSFRVVSPTRHVDFRLAAMTELQHTIEIWLAFEGECEPTPEPEAVVPQEPLEPEPVPVSEMGTDVNVGVNLAVPQTVLTDYVDVATTGKRMDL